jgi:hypothetical protein
MRNTVYAFFCAFLFSFLLINHHAKAQAGLTLYNMTYIPQANQLNPAHIPLSKVSISLPGISGNHFLGGSNISSLNGLGLDWGGVIDGEFDGDVFVDNLLDDLLQQAGSSNRAFANYQTDLLGVGVRIKHRHYLGFNIQQSIQSQVVLPYDAFRLARDFNRDFENGGGTYNFDGTSFSVVAHRPYTLTYAYEVSPEITFGVQASYITGIASLYSETEQAFFTQPADNPLGVEMSGRIEFATAGLMDSDSTFLSGEDILWGRQGNRGLGFGVGGTVLLLDDQLEISASAVNLGFINWRNNISTTVLDVNLVDQSDSIQQLFDELYDLEYTPNQSYGQNLHPQLFFGANYFLADQTSVGLLLRGTPVAGRLNPAIGAFFNTRVQKWLGVSVGYNYSDRSHQLATGLSLNLGPVQWYVVSDNLLAPFAISRVQQVQFSTGINLTFGRMSRLDRAPGTPLGLPEVPDEPAPVREIEGEEDYSNVDPFGPVPQDTLPDQIPAKEIDDQQPPVELKDPIEPDPYPELMAYVARVDAYMYRGPAANTIAIDTIPEAIEVEVLQKFNDSWWFVKGPKMNGWVQVTQLAPNPPKSKPYIPQPPVVEPTPEEGGNPTDPETTPPAPQGPVDDGVNYEVTEPIPLYRGPTTRSTKLMTIEPGTKVKAINKLSFSWWNVELPDHFGWINPESLIPAGVPGVIPNVQPVKPQPNPEAREIDPNEPVEEPQEEPESVEGPVYILLEATSLRSQPTHKSEVVLRFDPGDEVILLEETSKWWWKVYFAGTTGWVKSAKLVEK